MKADPPGDRSTRPIGEGCRDTAIPYIDTAQANGIITIHAACEPPCPRKRTAIDFIDRSRDG